MTAEPQTIRLPVTALIGTSLFFTGITYASTLNYGAIVGIDTLGIPNASYALLLMVASLVGAATSVVLGYFSDKVADRRLLVIACALVGVLGFGLIFLFRSPLAFIVATVVIMPFGGALYSQSFGFARSYYNRRDPQRAEFMNSMLRTVFTVAWIVMPPIVGVLAASTTVFNVYGVAALAYVGCAAIYVVLLGYPEAKIGVERAAPGEAAAPQPKASIEPVILAGIVGITLITVAQRLTSIAAPLLVTVSLKGSFADLGIFAGIAAALELPFAILWGYALRWVSKHSIIIGAALLFAAYLVLLSRATSITEVLWLQLLNGPATAALMSIPISYMQEAIKGRVGLSTSLLDVVSVVAGLGAATLFGALTFATPNYPVLFVVAAALAIAGAAILFTAHRVLGSATATSR